MKGHRSIGSFTGAGGGVTFARWRAIDHCM